MSDLHCAATLLVAPLGDLDQYGVRTMARSLAPRRVARVFTSTLPTAVRSGQVAADVLGVDAVALGELDGASSAGLMGRPAAGIPEPGWVLTIADQHRGETVLVLTDLGAGSPGPLEGVEGMVELSVGAWRPASRTERP